MKSEVLDVRFNSWLTYYKQVSIRITQKQVSAKCANIYKDYNLFDPIKWVA